MSNLHDEIRYYNKQITDARERLYFKIGGDTTIKVFSHPFKTINARMKLSKLDLIENGFAKARLTNNNQAIYDYMEQNPINIK